MSATKRKPIQTQSRIGKMKSQVATGFDITAGLSRAITAKELKLLYNNGKPLAIFLYKPQPRPKNVNRRTKSKS